MEDKKILYIALALVGGIMVGYMTGGANISVQDQGAAARTSTVADAVNVSATDTVSLTKLKEEQKIAQAGCTPGSRKYIKVISPNGGESFFSGQPLLVSWVSCNYPPTSNVNIIIVYYANGGPIYTQAQSLSYTVNDGFEYVALPVIGNPASYQSGNFYKIFISNGPGPTGYSLSDFSDNLFTISGVSIPGCTSYLGYSVTTGLPCWIKTEPATNVTSTTASLNGFLYNGAPTTITWNLIPASTSGMPIYTATSNGQLSPGNVSGLTPNTNYMFQACSQNTSQGNHCAGVISFTTLP